MIARWQPKANFRASPYTEALTFQTHNIGVRFSSAELLNLTQQELEDTTKNMNQFHLKDVSLAEARATFQRIKFSDEISNRQSYVIIGLICIAAIMLSLLLLYVGYKSYLTRRFKLGRNQPLQAEVSLDQMNSNATSVLDRLLEDN